MWVASGAPHRWQRQHRFAENAPGTGLRGSACQRTGEHRALCPRGEPPILGSITASPRGLPVPSGGREIPRYPRAAHRAMQGGRSRTLGRPTVFALKHVDLRRAVDGNAAIEARHAPARLQRTALVVALENPGRKHAKKSTPARTCCHTGPGAMTCTTRVTTHFNSSSQGGSGPVFDTSVARWQQLPAGWSRAVQGDSAVIGTYLQRKHNCQALGLVLKVTSFSGSRTHDGSRADTLLGVDNIWIQTRLGTILPREHLGRKQVPSASETLIRDRRKPAA
jgi:hypothetical protein